MADFHSLGTVGRQDQAGFESSAKFRTILPKTENSPQGNKLGLNTPFFQRENTENKYTCSGHSVKEFSLGKPQKYTFLSQIPIYLQEARLIHEN